MWTKTLAVGAGIVIFGTLFLAGTKAQEPEKPHGDCELFGPKQARFAPLRNRNAGGPLVLALSELTASVTASLPPPPPDSRTGRGPAPASGNLIDNYIFAALNEKNVRPAAPTTDAEFLRRASLDLTGRIPTSDRVVAFVNDTDPAKRTKLVDELIAKPEFVDKWTVFFADLYKNNSQNSQIRRFVPGVMAFNTWIRNSLTAHKPYDQMVRELIATTGSDSYTQGEVNFLAGGVVTGGPQQDIFDQQTANIAETFLGVAHVNCLLCHSGRGHLDALSIWGASQSRQSAWGMASFLSRTNTNRRAVNQGQPLPYYWSVTDNLPRDYQLNTTTGNRPARQPSGTMTSIAPVYMFTGEQPASGENYRAALARFVTKDPQFARATVNYLWEYFFGIGLVNPSNQFDPARLDPDNPPANCAPSAPCELQASNPRLLNALAQDFTDSKYDLRDLMRKIVNSRAYQLSARYDGAWNETWTTLFARKLVRRLWSEEVHDAVAQSSNVLPTYNNPAWGPQTWAMKFPEPVNTPDGAAGRVTMFLDSFLRGDRDEDPRRPDGSISQALSLMNDRFVTDRTRSTGSATSLLVRLLPLPDSQLVDQLFLNVLSRYPTAAEKSAALRNLAANRAQEAENLLWSLYNKVDFVFNY